MPEQGTFMTAREAELQAGRARVEERLERVDPKVRSEMQKRFKEADKEAQEDLKRRDEILNAPGVGDRAVRDRAAAEIVDQAQTALEALGHAADQVEKIVTRDQQLEMERQEGNADPQLATELTMDYVTAQAVNQPTVLANNEGKPTEEFALGSDERPVVAVPPQPERFVPPTRKKAEKKARESTPNAKEVVVPGWHPDNGPDSKEQIENRDVAVKAVDKVPNTALSVEEATLDNLLS